MTPQEAAIIKNVGNTLLINSALFLPESLLYGVFFYLFSHSTVIFMRRGLRSWPSKAMFITSLTTFICMGIHWATYSAGTFMDIKGTLIDDPANLGDARRLAAIGLRVFPIDVIQNWVDQLTIYISDGVVIWRAWVLFSDEIWMMIVPGTLFLATVGTGLAYLSFMTSPSIFSAVQLREPVLPMKLVTANLALSFTANVVATLLIAYKLWSHRKSGGVKALGSLSSVQKVLVALIESGSAYCALQLVRMVLYCYPGSVQSVRFYASGTVLSLATVATAMYPTVVIMLVNQQRTMVECFGLDPNPRSKGGLGDEEVGAATPGHLSFARSQEITHAETLSTQRSDISSERKTVIDISKRRTSVESNSDRQTKTSPF